MRYFTYSTLFVLTTLSFPGLCPGAEKWNHGFADSDGVKIHYVHAGKGPLLILIHGFPDYWYSWRDQIPTLAKTHHVVAIDQRGYNRSDQPVGVKNYSTGKLTTDIAAVITHFKQDQATIGGHDWGGFVAWSFAMAYPERTAGLIILNLPHPRGLVRELANNPQQHQNSEYARQFQQADAAAKLTAAGLADWVREEPARAKYIEAFKRSSFEGMLNFYKANYPRQPYSIPDQLKQPVRCPVLIIHGLRDPYLLSGALNDNWKWIEQEMTLVTVPTASHFVHRQEPELVTRHMVRWLEQR